MQSITRTTRAIKFNEVINDLFSSGIDCSFIVRVRMKQYFDLFSKTIKPFLNKYIFMYVKKTFPLKVKPIRNYEK